MTLINIPVPPSLNGIFANVRGKGRVKTEAYKKWCAEAGVALLAQRPQSVHGPVKIQIAIERSRGDLDNRIKAALDLLVWHGVIDDDRHVEEIHVKWCDAVKGADILVRAA